MNDFISPVKLPAGMVPFSMNMDVKSDVWNRRAGRDWSERYTGMAIGIFELGWEDGRSFIAAQIGGNFYNLSVLFDYLFDSTYRWLQQSPDLNWWNVTPDATTGAISPTVVTYTGTALTSNLTVTRYQLFGFRASATKIWRVRPDTGTGSLIREEYGISVPATLYSTDRAFGTGYGVIMVDLDGNSWKYEVDNAGIITKTTV